MQPFAQGIGAWSSSSRPQAVTAASSGVGWKVVVTPAFREPQNFMCSNLSKGDTIPEKNS